MGMLEDLLRGAQDVASRAYDQVNPWDGGKDWNQRTARPAPRQQPQQRRPQQQQVRQQPGQLSPQAQQRLAKTDAMLRQSQANIMSPMAILDDIIKGGQQAMNVGKDLTVGAITDAGNRVADFGEAGAEVIREVTGQNQAQYQQMNERANDYRNIAQQLAAKAQTEQDPARRARLIDGIKRVQMAEMETNAVNEEAIQRGMAATDPRKTLVNAGMTALDIATLGKGKVIMEGLQTAAAPVTKQVVGQLAKNTAITGLQTGALGAGYGGLETARNKDATAQDYLNNMTTGAALGAGLGVGAQIAMPVIGQAAKSTAKTTVKAANATKKEITKAARKQEESFYRAAAQDKILTRVEPHYIQPSGKQLDQGIVSQHRAAIINGNIDPIIVTQNADGTLKILDGEHRFQAYQELGVAQVPTRVVTPGEVRMMKNGGYIKLPDNASDDLAKKVFTKGTDDNALYHGTEADKAISILKDKKLKARAQDAEGKFPSELKTASDQTPFVSFSRQRNAGFYNTPYTGVRFVADADKVKSNLGKTEAYVDGEIKPEKYDGFEAEQRIGKDVGLENIRRIEINKKSGMTPDEEKLIRQLAKEQGIPVVDVDNAKDVRSVLQPKKQLPTDSPTTKDKILASKPVEFLYGDKKPVQQAKQKLSKFANKTVQNSDEVSNPLKKSVKAEKTTYDTTTDAGRIAYADDLIKDMDDDTAYTTATRILEEKNLNSKGQDAVTAIQIAKRLDAKGDETNLMKATEIYSQLSERLSSAGQEVQAASLLASRTPEGLRYKATKDLKNAGVKVTPEMELELRDKIKTVKTTQAAAEKATAKSLQLTKKYDGKRTDQQKEILAKARQEARQAENDLAVARDNVQYFVAEKIPSDTADKVINFWRSGLLTAPTTTAGAFAGNITGTLTRKLWINPTATMTDWALSLGTGKRTHLAAKSGEFGKGMKRGAKNVGSKQYWKTGVDTMDPMATSHSMGSNSRVINYGDSRLGKITTGYVNGVYKVMGGADQPFRYGAYDEVISSLAKTEAKNQKLTGWKKDNFIDDFIANPPKDAVETAVKEGMDSTFQNDTALAHVVRSTVQGLKQKGYNKTAAIVQSFAPFTGVPSSVADRIIRHTGITAGKKIVEAIKRPKGEKLNPQQQRELARFMGEGTIGLPVIAAGFALAANDMFSGAYPSDPQERQKWTDQGRQENSVKINGEWQSLNYIQPFGVLLSLGAGIQQTKGKDGQDAVISDYLSNGAMSAMKSFMGQSYLEGLQGPIEAFSAPEQNLGGYVSNTASSAVPNFIRSFARASDDVQRDTKGFVDGIAGAFPGTRQTLPEKLNSAGEPLPAKNTFLNQYVNPLKPSKAMESNPTMNEVHRLFDAGHGVTSSGMKTLKMGGETHKLDKKQQREYNEILGKAVYEKWSEVQKSDAYKSASDDDKSSMLSKARTKINNELKEQYIAGQPINLEKSKSATIKPTGEGNTTEVAPTLSKNYKDTLKEFDSLDTPSLEKKYYKENDAEYRYELAKYENKKASGALSKVDTIKKEAELARLEAGSKFPKEIRDLYTLNKTQMTALINKGELTEKQAEQIIAYGDALKNAGSSNKFRDSKGNASLALKGRSGGRGGRKSSGRKSTGKGKGGSGKALPSDDSTSTINLVAGLSKKVANTKVAKRQLPTGGAIRAPGIKAYKKVAKTNVSMTRRT